MVTLVRVAMRESEGPEVPKVSLVNLDRQGHPVRLGPWAMQDHVAKQVSQGRLGQMVMLDLLVLVVRLAQEVLLETLESLDHQVCMASPDQRGTWEGLARQESQESLAQMDFQAAMASLALQACPVTTASKASRAQKVPKVRLVARVTRVSQAQKDHQEQHQVATDASRNSSL
jgi:hypothetical protein